MARNGSGTYARTQSDYTFNTVIQETQINSELNDIATELTNSIDKDGQTPITGILKHSVTVGQTANTGSVQGNNPIITEFYEISTCANPGDSCTLPSAVAGQLVIIVNNGAQSADVFPASGDKIDGGSVNAAFALASGANALFICQDGTDWDSLGGGFFTPSSTTTLSAKTIDLDANTLTGTLAEFNTALQSESFASLGGSETLVSKTLTAPVLNDPTFDVAVGVTAHTGSAQGNGAITSTFVEISVCANPGDAVTLPTAAAGKLVIIANNGAESCDVFPASGDKIDGGSANVALPLGAGLNRIHICQDGTDWDTIGGALGADVVSGANIADDAIDSEHYTDGSIDNQHIADDAIDSEHYAAASIDTAHIATNQIDETLIKDAFVADFTEVVITSGDSLLLGDATDSGNTKRDTVQGILDLAQSLDATPDTDHTANGPQTSTLNAGYGSAIMDLVYLNANGKWLEADANATATSINLLGMALEAKTDGQAMNVALAGSFVRDDTFNWTIGVPLYVSGTLGAITETKPSGSGDVVRTIGYSVTADVIFFNPSSDYVTLA